ncbi:hypothetical protein [Fluviicola sp.]|uniref:hypothetical protein n=1 Tax=Fluviicola sp. TaxID=1917219 RepID=UPI003D2A89F9
MFNELTIQTVGSNKINLGQISESLLFYNKVNVLSSPSLFEHLVLRNELNGFKSLISEGRINLLIENNHLARAHSQNSNDWFSLLYVSGANVTPEELLVRQLTELTKKSGYSRRTARSIFSKATVYENHNSVIVDIIKDLGDEEYMKKVIYSSLNEVAPQLDIDVNSIKCRLHSSQGRYLLETNINYDEVNKFTGLNIDSQSIIGDLINSRLDAYQATKYNCDIHTSQVSSRLLQEKIHDLLHRTEFHGSQINLFNEYVLEGKTIKNAINSGERNLEELCRFLDNADKFKEWLINIDDDKNVLSEYIKAIGKESLLENSQVKTFKWYFFQSLSTLVDIAGAGGLASTLTNLALSAGDEFIIDNLFKGWKPNFFVDTDLKGFTKLS